MWRWHSVWIGLVVLLGPATSLAATIGLREVGTGNTSAFVAPGGNINLELYLDTEGLSFEGYYLGVDITGGAFTIQSVAQQVLPGLFPLFGAPVIDNVAGTIRKLNQATFTTPLLGAGVYVLEIINLEIGLLDPGAVLTATPGLFGEVLGLGGGVCPGGGCSVSVNSFEVVPEPGTGLLVSCGLLSLAVRRRHANVRALAHN